MPVHTLSQLSQSRTTEAQPTLQSNILRAELAEKKAFDIYFSENHQSKTAKIRGNDGGVGS